MGSESDNIDLENALGATSVTSEQNLTVYVPSADKQSVEIQDQQFWIRQAADLLARIGGGVTIMPPMKGGWLTPQGNVIWEKPVLVYTYIKPDNFIRLLPDLRTFLHKMGRETNQGEIACQFDGIFYRITHYDTEATS